jgi:monoamine oxidase
MREARLSLAPHGGSRWSTRSGEFAPDESRTPHARRFYQALRELQTDVPIAQFLETLFADRQYDELRRSVTRMVEGYDAADPHRASTFAVRDEWLARGEGQQGRMREGYGALVAHLEAECREHGATIRLGATVTAIDEDRARIAAHCRDGAVFEADAAVLAVPLPVLSEVALPATARERAGAGAEIGFGNVVKILLRFATRWWSRHRGRDLADLSFLFSHAKVPTWWTQYPARHPVFTGWFAGPKADTVARLDESELIAIGLASLAETFELPAQVLAADLIASRAINWGNDPFARGAYSYATPQSRDAQSALREGAGAIFFSGEALYGGPDMGTVEAALASGVETAQRILGTAA